MAALARWCFRHRKIVLPAWLIALVLVAGIAKSVGSSYSNNFSFPSTDSTEALNIVQANFPAQSGDSDQIVVQAKAGTLATADVAAAVNAMLTKVASLKFVTEVSSPYKTGLVSKNGTIGIATVQLNAQAQNITTDQAEKLIHTAQAVNAHLVNVQLGGAAIQNGEQQSGGGDFLVGALARARGAVLRIPSFVPECPLAVAHRDRRNRDRDVDDRDPVARVQRSPVCNPAR